MSREMRLKLKYFLMGVLFSGMIFMLTAATSSSPPAPHYGRYQISSWAGQVGPEGGSVGAFVLDTSTGETKTVYSRVYGNVGNTKVERNNLKTPFGSMK